MRLIVHGGAGGVPDDPEPRQQTLDEAAATGASQGTPVDAVEAALRVLETDPAFNAGVGGAVQSDGRVRTDAGVMTSDRETGAVAGMDGVEHAVSVARVVMEETPHVFVAGRPAVDVADAFGVETGVDLFTTETRERWADANPPEGSPRDHLAWLEDRFGGTSATASNDADLSDHDTVGAVAYDGDRFAAATSTGGRWFALAGRVGDVPQVGSGFYAAPAGAASATGAGEDIAKATLTRRAVGHVERGLNAQSAAELAIEEFAELTGSGAGVIVADDEGVGSAFNTDGMQTGVAER
ncbi:isoaspartyl peptidase/L-asparaginase [Halogeometricum limi]|uniref:Plant-type L-asparaginase n=1 Tax=Halogeometricum limi TaxID=555875 RepID=A0A1I6HJ02_9EURY|nr:isoaspartyl peptidase/L-asparaginase [Halogeometricum limi]SFR54449.1 beta-aspartyl-peptidase (threonine type) [Halogeometricum limi]